MTTANAPGDTALRYSPIIALIVASATFMQNLDGAIINTSLPQMARSFGVTTVSLSLGITAYMLASAAMAPASNWLAERFGTRTILASAILLFTAASLWCGLGHGLTEFVLARVLQGIGGALMGPVGMAAVMRNTPKSDMLRATALTSWPALMAPILGPVLGGFITETLNWRWNFWINLPIGLLGALAVLRFVPEDRGTVRRTLDVTGFLLCALGLTCLLGGFQRSSMSGIEREVAIGLIVIGLVTGLLAIRRLHRHPEPVLSLSPLSRPSFFHTALMPGMAYRALFSTAPFLLPLLFQLGFGLSPAVAGGWVLVYFVGNLGIKPLTTRILRRFGFRPVMLVDGLLVALSMAGCALVGPHTSRFVLVPLLLFAGSARSMQLTSLTTLAFADVPAAERGSASTLLSVIQQAASAAGVAIAAFTLSVARSLLHHQAVGMPEFHLVFALLAVVALLAALAIRSMPRGIGAEVSGHHA